jgi:hypothetical protein
MAASAKRQRVGEKAAPVSLSVGGKRFRVASICSSNMNRAFSSQ